MRRWFRFLRWLALLALVGALLGAIAIYLVYRHYEPQLPEVATLRDVRFQVPLKVYSRDGKLIANFGEARRFPAAIDDVPDVLKQAFIATEDERYYEHPGVDYQGMARVGWEFVRAGGEFGSGGSTITMQLARNFFLTPERRYERKFKEILLALKIEQELSKDEILGLYLNKIFLGQRAYGVAAAAQVYYGKALADLTLTEAAMIAGLPKAPSDLNPIQNPQRALERRDYVLGRMLDVGYIDAATHAAAIATPETARIHELPIELEAPYVAEMARLEAEQLLGSEEALTGGYSVYTSVDSRLQLAANSALRTALTDYEERHGYRGPEAHAQLDGGIPDETALRILKGLSPTGGLLPALVLTVSAEAAELVFQDGSSGTLDFAEARWARRYVSPDERGPAPKSMLDLLKPGDVIRARATESGTWRLTQIPTVQGALVALDPEDGSIRALVGGFSFGRSKFNRATQSDRNPGSSFKPFVYSAAFEKGFTAASIVNDAPIVFDIPGVEKAWRPQNDNQTFSGPIRLREAMVRSKNLVSIRVLDAIGVGYARRYIERFGFDPKKLPENLSLALGTASAPPLIMARGFAVFANGGFRVEPHLIERIDDSQGNVAYSGNPSRACAECPERIAEEFDLQAVIEGTAQLDAPADASIQSTPTGPKLAPRAIDARNAYLITSLLMDVVKRGTGRKAMELGRSDLAGKTGTTNEHRDAWFSGFNQSLVATAWMGFDDFSTLGDGEFAAKTALPMWINFMGAALEDAPQTLPAMPTGITTARINSGSGQLTSASDPGAIMENFRVEDLERLGRSASAGGREDPYEVF
jgi:penicillin-binding protein 1A